jgi:hypothetical protein
MGIETVIASTVISGILGAVAARNQAAASENQARYQAQVAANNKIIADRKAVDASERGEVAAQNQQVRTRQQIALLAAGAAARGVETGSGSALDLTSDAAAEGKRDELVIRSDSEREALAFREQGRGFAAEESLRINAAKNAKTAGRLNVASSLVSTGTSVATKWHDFGKVGVGVP